MTTASRRRRAQAAGPQRFQAPVHSARPPVWRSLLSGLVLAAVIIGLPAAIVQMKEAMFRARLSI